MGKGKGKLIIFDMDGVLTQHSSSWQYVHNRIGVDNRKNYELFKNNMLSYEEFLESDVKLWNSVKGGIDMKSVISILDEIPLRENLSGSMSRLKNHGSTLAIISGGISWLADRINRIYPFDYTFSNTIATNESGAILPYGNTQVNPLKKGEIVERLQEAAGIDSTGTIAVGDSIQDVPMFERSAFSVAFNPMDLSVPKWSSATLRSNNLSDLADLIERECLLLP